MLRNTTLYSIQMVDNSGRVHDVCVFGIDQITDDSRQVDLTGVGKVFSGARLEVYERPSGPIDILIGEKFVRMWLHTYGNSPIDQCCGKFINVVCENPCQLYDGREEQAGAELGQAQP